MSTATVESLIQGVLKRDRRAVARSISLVERADASALQLVEALYPRTGGARIVGVTGAPGSGKSTLVGALAQHYRTQGLSVGILAVDPSSPFSGGALLGDRIRMARPSEDSEVFIRSMASRGDLGGLAPSAYAALQILDAAGYERILVETVGTGQAEVDIVSLAHTTLVVLVPGMGDEVQVFKAGIMEIADVYVVNKADRDGAVRLVGAIRTLLEMAEAGYQAPIVNTVATRGEGIAALAEAVEAHWRQLSSTGGAGLRARRQAEHVLRKTLQHQLGRALLEPLRSSGSLDALLDRIVARQLSPLRAAHELADSALSHAGQKGASHR